jgi:hypothetical protein
LSKRLCTLAKKVNAKATEADDGQEFTELTFELEAVSLDATELNAILQEPHAHQVLFNTGVDPTEPYLKSLKALELGAAIEGAYVSVELGLENHVQFEFTDCKISKIKLTLATGGATLMSCRVTVKPTLNDTLAELLERLGHTVTVEIRGEVPGAQQDLPLNRVGHGEQATSSIGTPQQEREKARERERKLAAELEMAHHAPKPKGRRARGADSVN